MEQGSRTKLVAALVLSLVFGSGLLLGYAASGGPADAMTVESSSDDAPSTGRRNRPYVYETMNPTAEQRASMDSIMVVHRERMNVLHEEFGVAQQAYDASYDALIQQTRDALAAVFPEERRAEYRRRLEEEYDRPREERARQGDRR
ncbi:MAG: hypothetical protein FJ207_10900 [Gemmatimonadetes bacterium]|nr:hypothetical protein [Gemmatimonadota bacterium]